MKISKLAASVFAVAGTILLIGALVLCAVALNRPSRSVSPTKEANDFALSVLSALDSDFASVEEYLYGKPSLGLDREPATAEGKQVWNAYRDSIVVTTDAPCFGEGANLFQTAQVTAMDLGETLSRLNSEAAALLKQKLETAEDPAALLDENGEVPRKLRDEVRAQALSQVLADAKTVTRQITFQLIEKDGQWWAVPDQALLDILSADLP